MGEYNVRTVIKWNGFSFSDHINCKMVTAIQLLASKGQNIYSSPFDCPCSKHVDETFENLKKKKRERERTVVLLLFFKAWEP